MSEPRRLRDCIADLGAAYAASLPPYSAYVSVVADAAEALARLQALIPREPRRTLHMRAEVYEEIREIASVAGGDLGPPILVAAFRAAAFSHEVDVFIDHDLPDGGWELREDGEVTCSGQLARSSALAELPETDSDGNWRPRAHP